MRKHNRGGGVVHADPWAISSTVVELDGQQLSLLVIHLFLHGYGCGFKVVHRLDNMAVVPVQGTNGSHARRGVCREHRLTEDSVLDRVRRPCRQTVSKDMQADGTQVETVWSKGHPEKYKQVVVEGATMS